MNEIDQKCIIEQRYKENSGKKLRNFVISYLNLTEFEIVNLSGMTYPYTDIFSL